MFLLDLVKLGHRNNMLCSGTLIECFAENSACTYTAGKQCKDSATHIIALTSDPQIDILFDRTHYYIDDTALPFRGVVHTTPQPNVTRLVTNNTKYSTPKSDYSNIAKRSGQDYLHYVIRTSRVIDIEKVG